MRHERGENRKRCFQTNWQILIHVFTFPVSPFKEWFVRFIGVSNNSVELIMIIYHRVMQAIFCPKMLNVGRNTSSFNWDD